MQYCPTSLSFSQKFSRPYMGSFSCKASCISTTSRLHKYKYVKYIPYKITLYIHSCIYKRNVYSETMRISDRFFGTYLNTHMYFRHLKQECAYRVVKTLFEDIYITRRHTEIYYRRDIPIVCVLNYSLSDFDRYQNCCINYNCYLRFALN